ncbi:MAG: NERD domain-containing protein [Pirellulaceae bacterium]
MARMIPPKIHPEVKSSAERRFFDWIRDEAGTEDWICLHSLGLSEHEAKRRAEIDFLLLTRFGIFVLEVKGGRVTRKNGEWHFTDRYGKTTTKSEGPFDQASGAMFGLERRLKQHFEASGQRQKNLLYGFGVVMPDTPFSDLIGTEAERRQLYDRDSIRTERLSIKAYINRLAEYWRERSSLGNNPGRYAPTEKDIEDIFKFLRGDFDRVPSIGAIADASCHQMHALEAAQYQVLDAMEKYPVPRIMVQGGAGTGKTLLAVEIAKREALRTGGDILFLCFNRVLAGVLRHNVKAPERGSITVDSIHSVLADLMKDTSCEQEFQQRKEGLKPLQIFNELMPELGYRAMMEKECKRYATLIVDEAQDMLSQPMLDVMNEMLEKGLKDGRWWVFLDRNNQASVFGVYDDDAMFRLMTSGVVVMLTTNCRNTIPIATETEIVTLPQFPPSATIDGLPVQTRWYRKSDDQRQLLRTTMNMLINEDVDPRRITVLSCRKVEDCCAHQLGDSSLALITEDNGWKVGSTLLNQITYCTVSSFKGLENDFVILTDVDEVTPEWWKGVVYVGMSRARIGLYLLINDKLRPLCDERRKDWLRKNMPK